MKKRIRLTLVLLLFASVLAGCSSTNSNTVISLETAKIGIVTGTIGEDYVRKELPESTVLGFSNVMEAVSALKANKLDAILTVDITAVNIAKENPDLQALTDYRLTTSPVCIAVAKENPQLLSEIDDIITQLKTDGTIADMEKRWIKIDMSPVEPADIPEAAGEVLKVGVAATYEPFNYIDNGKIVGYAPELAMRIGEKLGRRIEFIDMNFSALVAALQSGKIDAIISLITPTPEREKAVDFTQGYYSTGQILLKRQDTNIILSSELISRLSQLDGADIKTAVPTGVTSGSTLQNSDFIGKKFAVITGTMLDKIVNDNLGNNELLYFNTMQDAIEAVKNKKVDASINDEPILRKSVAKNPELTIITPSLTIDEYGLVVSKDNPQLTAKLNEFFDTIKSDGMYDEMIARWIDNKDTADMPDIPLTAKNGTLKMATSAITEPFAFYGSDGKIVGFDIEYGRRFAQFMGMEFEVIDMDFGAIISSVQSGKTDFGSSLITITEERAKSIDFTKPYYIGGTSIIVLGDTADAKIGFIEGVKNSFYQNLIVENRYQMVLQGLWVTIIISVFSLILGTVLGFLICFLSMSKNKLLNWISKIYVGILRGTPMVVLLMIIFYIVFAKVDINPIIVAIIAFGLNGGAFIGEIIRSALLTVDKGQIEAARSMGFSSTGTFFIVTLPQAIRVALPVYKSEFISMMKQTAIVGYIAIVDLTKVGDIIRSRTYDAFFPLIAVAVVYLITVGVFIKLFDMLYKRTDKRQRRIKG